jgi:glutathione S-transferase
VSRIVSLVHDGVLYIESIDIIEYLDDAFGGDPLMPRDPERAADAHLLVERGKQLHVSIR